MSQFQQIYTYKIIACRKPNKLCQSFNVGQHTVCTQVSVKYMSYLAWQWVDPGEWCKSLNVSVCSLFLGTFQTECILGKGTRSAKWAWFVESDLPPLILFPSPLLWLFITCFTTLSIIPCNLSSFSLFQNYNFSCRNIFAANSSLIKTSNSS